MNCRKCNETGTVLIRKEYCYCDDCFNINTNHKFRACIGKNKMISPNDKILICLSGDSNSTVLLHLIHTSISLNTHKKLRIVPHFLHILESDKTDNIKNSILEHCQRYNFDIEFISINEYIKNNGLFETYNTSIKNDLINAKNVPATIKYDMLKKIKQNIILEVAKNLNCKLVFTAETNTALATRLLTNLSLGRGSQVENDVGFVDNRDPCIKILRPMKDISNEEIECYISINKLKPPHIKEDKKNSLQSVIQSFVLDLQENYSATISTICKTADKMSSHCVVDSLNKCSVCKSTFNVNHTRLTAVDATIFSKKVSLTKHGEEVNVDNYINNDNRVFPMIYENLCYCCSRNYAELQDSK